MCCTGENFQRGMNVGTETAYIWRWVMLFVFREATRSVTINCSALNLRKIKVYLQVKRN